MILKASVKQMEFATCDCLTLLAVSLLCLKTVASLTTMTTTVREVDLKQLQDKTKSVSDSAHQTTPAPIWLVSKSLFVTAPTDHQVNRSGNAISSSILVDRISRPKQSISRLSAANGIKSNVNETKRKQPRDWFTLALVDEDPVGSAATPAQEDATLLQTIKNQAGEPNADQLPSSDDPIVSYQGGGQLATLGPVSQLNQSFLSLFDELWLIKNASAMTLIRLNYFGSLTGMPNRIGPIGNWNQDRLHSTNTNFNQDRRSAPVPASGKEQVAGRLFQTAGRTISNWISIAQQRLSRFRERLGLVLREHTNRKWTKTNANNAHQLPADHRVGQAVDSLLREPETLLDDSSGQDVSQQNGKMARNRARLKRGYNFSLKQFQSTQPQPFTDFDIVWQQQRQSDWCNKLTIDEENKCRSTEQTINSNLNYSFPGTLRAIEENCRHVNYLLTNCWIQQSVQLRMSLASRNESTQNFTNQPPPSSAVDNNSTSNYISNEQSQPFSVLVDGCGVEPSSPQYIRDRVSWMWLNLCIDKRFRRGYTSNLICLSVWNQPRAQRLCGSEYNRMQNYLLSQANGGRAAALGLNYNWTTNAITTTATTVSSSGEKSATVRNDYNQTGDNNNAQTTSRDKQAGGTNAAVASVAATAEAAGVSSSQLVAATTRGLSESELIDREVSSKMLCCMFDQFLRCVHKQAQLDCGRRGAQFVVDFMSRIGTDDMKYLCNADSKSSPPPPQPPPATTIDTRNQPANWLPVSMQPPSPYTPNVPRPSLTSFAPHLREPIDKQHPLAATRDIGSSNSNNTRNPFIDNNYCIDPRIQNALTAFSSSPGSSDPATGTNSNSKNNPNGPSRMRLPSYDPAYFETRDYPSNGSANNSGRNHNQLDLLVVFVSLWLLKQTLDRRALDYAIPTG